MALVTDASLMFMGSAPNFLALAPEKGRQTSGESAGAAGFPSPRPAAGGAARAARSVPGGLWLPQRSVPAGAVLKGVSLFPLQVPVPALPTASASREGRSVSIAPTVWCDGKSEQASVGPGGHAP